MIHLLDINDQAYKLDDETGETWYLGEDSDDKPVWIFIGDFVEDEESRKEKK